jgi:hypothetical protein
MDPTATFTQYLATTDPYDAGALATALIGWLANGGFEPTHPDWDLRARTELAAAVAYAAWLADGAVDSTLITHLHLGSAYLLIEHDDDGFHAELVGYDRTGGRSWERQLDPTVTFRDAFAVGFAEYAVTLDEYEWVEA